MAEYVDENELFAGENQTNGDGYVSEESLFGPPPPPDTSKDGYLVGAAKSLQRSALDIPVQVGKALEYNADYLGSGTTTPESRDESELTFVNKAGKSLADAAESMKVAPADYGNNEGKRAVFQGVESMLPSMAYAAPGLVGGAIGSAVGLGGTLAGAAVGQVPSSIIMYRAQAQQAADELDQLRQRGMLKDGVTNQDILSSAQSSGHHEWMGEAISDIPENIIFNRIPFLGAAVKSAGEALRPGLKQFGKLYAETLLAEQVGEGWTQFKQEQDRNLLLPEEFQKDPWEAAKEQAGPTTVMTLGMALLGRGAQGVRARRVFNTLQDENASAEKRLDAANNVAGLLMESNGPEQTRNFLDHVNNALFNPDTPGAIDLSDPALLQPIGEKDLVPERKSPEAYDQAVGEALNNLVVPDVNIPTVTDRDFAGRPGFELPVRPQATVDPIETVAGVTSANSVDEAIQAANEAIDGTGAPSVADVVPSATNPERSRLYDMRQELLQRRSNEKSLEANSNAPVTPESSLLAQGLSTDAMQRAEAEAGYQELFGGKSLLSDAAEERLSLLERQMAGGEVGSRFQKDDGTWDGVKSTNPEWLKSGPLKEIGKAGVRRVIELARTGGKMTNNQQFLWAEIKKAADKEYENDPATTQARETERIQGELGIDLHSPESIPVGNLDVGDKAVVIGSNGLPDVVTHKGYNGDGKAILKDGITVEADPWDMINTMGVKPDEGRFEQRMRDVVFFGAKPQYAEIKKNGPVPGAQETVRADDTGADTRQTEPVAGTAAPASDALYQQTKEYQQEIGATPTLGELMQQFDVDIDTAKGLQNRLNENNTANASTQSAPEAVTSYQDNKSLAESFGFKIENGPSPKHSGGFILIPDIDDGKFIDTYGADKKTVVAHEIAHGLLNKWGMTGEIKGEAFSALRKELRGVSRQESEKKWELHSRHAGKSQELLADGISRLILDEKASLPELEKILGNRIGDIRRSVSPNAKNEPQTDLSLTGETQTTPARSRMYEKMRQRIDDRKSGKTKDISRNPGLFGTSQQTATPNVDTGAFLRDQDIRKDATATVKEPVRRHPGESDVAFLKRRKEEALIRKEAMATTTATKQPHPPPETSDKSKKPQQEESTVAESATAQPEQEVSQPKTSQPQPQEASNGEERKGQGRREGLLDYAQRVSEASGGDWAAGIYSKDGNIEYNMPNPRSTNNSFMLDGIQFTWSHVSESKKRGHSMAFSNSGISVSADGKHIGTFKFSGIAGEESKAVKSALNAMRRYTDEKKTSTPSDSSKGAGAETPPASKEKEKLQDFGEKIGGARKDTATKGTERQASKPKEETGWRTRYKVVENSVSPGVWFIADTKSTSRWGNILPQKFASEEEARKAVPLVAVSRQHSVLTDRDAEGKFAIFKNVTDRKRVKVVNRAFDSREEGMKYMALHAEEILDLKTTFGEEILPVPEIAIRKGPERRQGPATPELFMETFAPRGIEFGNWNNQEERQQVLDHAYDGLLDLAEVLDVPPKALMLNGELAIAFGARGKGLSGAKAHYETDYGVINLTKMSGAGSLAHEWFHALDHYLARQDTKAESNKTANNRGDMVFPAQSIKYQMQSHGESLLGSQVRPELQDSYSSLIEAMFKKAEQYVEDTKTAEKFIGSMKKHLRESLDRIRNELAADRTSYAKKNGGWRRSDKGLSPASAEQLAEFDRLADVLVEGGNLDLETRSNVSDEEREKLEKSTGRQSLSARGRAFSYRQSNDTLDAINDIYKAVRGRSGFTKDGGILADVAASVKAYAQRLKMFEDAKNSVEKTKKVPTRFAIEARKMDQARSGDYWSEPHEMAARAFAAYVEDKIAEQGRQSDFIVYHAHGGILLPMIDGFVARPYPEGDERKALAKAFDRFVSELKTKETDKGVALYSKTKGEGVVASLTGEEISGEDLFESAKKYFHDTLQGKVFHRPEIGDVRVTGKGWKKTKRGLKTDDLKAKLIPAIPDVIAKGTYHGREPVEGRRDDIVAFHYFDGSVQVGESVVQVGATVAEDSRGNLFYNINHDADLLWAKRKALHELRLEARGGEPSAEDGDTTSVKYSIGDEEEAVNITILSEDGRLVSQPLPVSQRADIEAELTDKLGRFRVRRLLDKTVTLIKSQEEAKRIVEGLKAKLSAAFHGSPHDFERFRMDKVGNGEGAQAYGHGLYFSGKKEVAEYYRKSVTAKQTRFSSHAKALRESNPEAYGLIEKAIEKDSFHGTGPLAVGQIVSDLMSGHPSMKTLNLLGDNFDRINKAVEPLQTTGRLYEVELAPQEDEYLLWDKPLSEQSEKVKEALGKADIRTEYDQETINVFGDLMADGPEILKEEWEGKDIYRDATRTKGSDKYASEYLHSLGIRGIKYLDGSSRGKGEGFYNYVIFDENDVEIKVKYSKYGAIQGFTAGGKVYLVKDGIEQGQAYPVLLHELGEHVAQLGFSSDPEYRRILKGIELRSKFNDATGKAIQKAMARVPEDTNPEHYWSEVAAYLVENEANNTKISIVDRILSFFKKLMVKAGVIGAERLNHKDIVIFAQAAVRAESGVSVKDAVQRSMKAVRDVLKPVDTNSAEFKRWFGDSKVVNDDGEPLRLVHGSNEDFGRFLKNKLGNETWGNANSHGMAGTSLLGFWMNSGEISENENAPYDRYYQVYARIENPYRASSVEGIADDISRFLPENAGDRIKSLETLKKYVGKYRDSLIGKGYDGIELADEEFGGTSYVVFSPTQIKSAISNTGDFSPTDPRIQYSRSLFKPVDPNSPVLKRWLGNSQITEPVHHGSPEIFWTFDAGKLGKNAASPGAGMGFFFATDRTESQGYAGPDGQNRAFYVKIEHPKTMNSYDLPKFRTQEEAKAYAKRQQLAGYDGIILKDEGHVIVFENNQVKSAEINTGEFSSDNPDVRYSKSSKEKGTISEKDPTAQETGEIAERMRKKVDISPVSPIVFTADHTFRKYGATKRALQEAYDRHDHKFQMENWIMDGTVSPDEWERLQADLPEDQRTAYSTHFAETHNKFIDTWNNSAEEHRKTAGEHLLKVDETGKAFRLRRVSGHEVKTPDGFVLGIRQSIDDARELIHRHHQEFHGKKSDVSMEDYTFEKVNRWDVINPDGALVSSHIIEAQAVDRMMQAEQDKLIKDGIAPEAVELVMLFRVAMNRAFDMQVQDLRAVIKEREENNMPPLEQDIVDENQRWAIRDKRGKNLVTFATKDEAVAMLHEMAKYKKRYALQAPVRQTDAEITRPGTLHDYIALVGDLRGSYFPRQRQDGAIIMAAHNQKTGDRILKKFDLYIPKGLKVDEDGAEVPPNKVSEWLRNKLNRFTPLGSEAHKLAKQGYDITISRDNKNPESVFDAGPVSTAINALMQESLENSKMPRKDADNAAFQKAYEHLHRHVLARMAEQFKQRGSLSSRLQRSVDHWRGFETDPVKAAVIYTKGMAGSIAKRQMAQGITLALTGRDISWKQYKEEHPDAKYDEFNQFVTDRMLSPKEQPNLYKEAMSWTREVLRNDEAVDRIIGTLRGLATVKYLGFRVSSAAVNLTNMMTAVPGTIAADTGGKLGSALAQVAKSIGAYNQYRLGNGSDLDKKIFTEIAERGWDVAQYNTEAAGVLRGKLSGAYSTFVDWSMKMFGMVEQLNRAATIHAAYMEAKANKPNLSHKELMRLANQISNDAHGKYGKETSPVWTRGSFNPLRLTWTFQKFSQNYTANIIRMWGNKHYKDAAWVMLSPAILGGIGATLPGAILGSLGRMLGLGDGDDPEEEFYKWAEKNLGRPAALVARLGMPSLAGVSIKGSMQVNNQLPTTLEELLGAPGSIFFDMRDAAKDARKGAYSKAAEKFLPTAIGSVFKAVREYDEGVTTGQYSRMYYGDQPLKATGYDAFLRGLSFSPANQAAIREEQWREKEIVKKYQQERSDINAKIKHSALQNNGRIPQDDLLEIVGEVENYNNRVMALGIPGLNTIKKQNIREVARSVNRVPKREKERSHQKRIE